MTDASRAPGPPPHNRSPNRARIGGRVFAKDPASIGLGADPWRIPLKLSVVKKRLDDVQVPCALIT